MKLSMVHCFSIEMTKNAKTFWPNQIFFHQQYLNTIPAPKIVHFCPQNHTKDCFLIVPKLKIIWSTINDRCLVLDHIGMVDPIPSYY